MSYSRLYHIRLMLRHAWLNLWDKHMTTGRINQISVDEHPYDRQGILRQTIFVVHIIFSVQRLSATLSRHPATTIANSQCTSNTTCTTVTSSDNWPQCGTLLLYRPSIPFSFGLAAISRSYIERETMSSSQQCYTPKGFGKMNSPVWPPLQEQHLCINT